MPRPARSSRYTRPGPPATAGNNAAQSLVVPESRSETVLMRRGTGPASVIAAGLLCLTGCTSSSSSPAEPRLDADQPTFRVQPSTATPGAEVSVTAYGPRGRPQMYTMTRWDGDGWSHNPVYCLHSDSEGKDQLGYGPWPDACSTARAQRLGSDPDRIPVPPEAEAGTYRLCEADPDHQRCALLYVS